ncbi:hypothetical protein F2Q70_00042406 [Brassica cretica]|uniref:Uncharacterized protein n=1 Tax=Brassica cretica TaxID=69181 RepID=A0A8S9KQ42_BRACR|nr:hypothetical protein F2Q70_00042406 [Brassica cretica]
MVCSWRYVHDDVYGDLSLAVCRLTLHPWQLAPMVHNSVLTDRSRNHPGISLSRSLDSDSRNHSAQIDLSQSLGSLSLSRSLDSHSRSYSAWIVAVTRIARKSRA